MWSIRRLSFLSLALIAVLVSASVPLGRAASKGGQPLVLTATIPLENVSGRIDHMAIDLARHHLVVAELGNDTVDVIDLASGRSVHRIGSLSEPQGVAFAAAADVFVVANGGDGSVLFFRAEDFAPAGRIELGDDADNVRVDAATGRVTVGFGGGALATIDPATRTKIIEIPLAAHPEGFQLTRDGARAFVNLPGAHQIAVVDVAAGHQVGEWSVPELGANFPMAIDATDKELAVAYRSPPRLVLLDAASGAVRANLETCGDPDDVFFDADRKRIYVSCGQGVIDVFDHGEGVPRRIARIDTSSGARTALFVPELASVFVAAPAGWFAGEARILVYRAVP